VAIETEFQILNTLLAEKAAQLTVTENQLFRIFCRWEGVTAKIGSPTLQREIDRQLARVVLERDDVLEVVEGELGKGGGG